MENTNKRRIFCIGSDFDHRSEIETFNFVESIAANVLNDNTEFYTVALTDYKNDVEAFEVLFNNIDNSDGVMILYENSADLLDIFERYSTTAIAYARIKNKKVYLYDTAGKYVMQYTGSIKDI